MAYAYRLNHRGGFKPEAVTGFSAFASATGEILVYWIPPAKHYSGIMVRYSIGDYPPTIADGTLGGDGTGNDYTIGGVRVKGFLITGLAPATTYYFSGFSYYEAGGSRRYAKDVVHTSAQSQGVDPSPSDYSGTSVVIDGIGLGLTGNGVYTVPAGIYSLDVFCVGGGGGGGGRCESYGGNEYGGGGGGGGYAVMVLAASVTPGQQIQVTIGAGGSGGAQYIVTSEDMDGQAQSGNAGGTTSFGAICSASGGAGGQGGATTYGAGVGGAGGSGGGGGGAAVSGQTFGGDGGSNGGAGQAGYNGRSGGAGQGTSTHAFGGAAGIAYSGGGGGSFNGNGGATGGGNGDTSGTANTGGGGGGGSYNNGASGGSGIVIIRRAA